MRALLRYEILSACSRPNPPSRGFFPLQVRVSGLELGGLLGSLIAGRISDWYIATSPGGAVGKRIQVVMAYLIGVAAMLIAFKAVPSGKNPSQTRCFLLIWSHQNAGLPFLQAIIVFMIGFFLYGPQMLIGATVIILGKTGCSTCTFSGAGLCGAEIVGRRSVGASEGFLGWIAYLVSIFISSHKVPTEFYADSTSQGAANAGVPLSLLVQQYGWNAFFSALLLACAAAILLLAPITSAQSHIQRSAKDQAILRWSDGANLSLSKRSPSPDHVLKPFFWISNESKIKCTVIWTKVINNK